MSPQSFSGLRSPGQSYFTYHLGFELDIRCPPDISVHFRHAIIFCTGYFSALVILISIDQSILVSHSGSVNQSKGLFNFEDKMYIYKLQIKHSEDTVKS